MTIKTRQILLLSGDIILLYLSLITTLVIGFWDNFYWEIFLKHLFPFSILYFFWLIIFYIFGFYDLILIRTFFAFYTKILIGLGFSLVFGVIFFYLVPAFGITPKTNLVLNVLVFGIFVFVWRKFFYLLSSFHFQNKIIIIGSNPQAKELAQTIQNNPQIGYKLISFLDPKENIYKKVQDEKINTLILTESLEPYSQLTKNLYQCLPLKLNFMDLARAYEIICEKIPISFVGQSWFLENLKEGEKEIYEKIKKSIDIILASLLLSFTLPLWLFISLAIKLEDGGPIFYSQKRVGRNKKIFSLIKFRSMVPRAEKKGPCWAEKEDERITRVGEFLRKTHLDEIPQMINVLKDDISLVGPRPERPEFISQLEKTIPHYHLRHIIKPGFTGWAQVKFPYARSVEDSYKKFQYDLYYLKNRSLILYIRILLKTFELFLGKE